MKRNYPTCLLLISFAVALAGCQINDVVDDDWPCDADRPCESGFQCVDNICVKDDNDDPNKCQPDCAGKACDADDGCEGTCPCDAPLQAVEVSSISFVGAEPKGLAFDRANSIYCGDEGDRTVRHYMLGDGQQDLSGALSLPADGELVDLAWVGGNVIAAMDDDTLYRLFTVVSGQVATMVQGNLLNCTGVSYATPEYFFTHESDLLKHRAPTDFSTLGAVALDDDCSFLGADSSTVVRYCGGTGAPGDWHHTFTVYEAGASGPASLQGQLNIDIDAKDVTGIDLGIYDGKLTLWVVGRSYGEKDKVITAYQLEGEEP